MAESESSLALDDQRHRRAYSSSRDLHDHAAAPSVSCRRVVAAVCANTMQSILLSMARATTSPIHRGERLALPTCLSSARARSRTVFNNHGQAPTLDWCRSKCSRARQWCVARCCCRSLSMSRRLVVSSWPKSVRGRHSNARRMRRTHTGRPSGRAQHSTLGVQPVPRSRPDAHRDARHLGGHRGASRRSVVRSVQCTSCSVWLLCVRARVLSPPL